MTGGETASEQRNEGWLPIALCPTDGVERWLKLSDGFETAGCFLNPPGSWRVWRISIRRLGSKLDPVGGVERTGEPWETRIYSDLPDGVVPTHFRPNDTVYGPPDLVATPEADK